MNSKQSLAVATISILASLGSVSAQAYAPSDDGLNRRVEILNTSSYAIVKLEAINVSGVGTWHTYLNRVKVGGSSSTVIDDGLGYCRFNMHLLYADGSDAFFPDVNVCDADWLTFSDLG